MLRRQGGAFGFGVVLLAMHVLRTGIGNIPPVTLGFLALNSAIYMRLLRVVRHVGDACVSFQNIWRLRQWRRLVLASFVHLDDMHLYFNMISFLWKGRTLERRYGSRKFFIIVMVFAVASQVLLTVLNRVMATLFWNQLYLTSCAAGFSAVIFALKVLTTQNMWEESVGILGFPVTVPAQFACWIELVLIQIFVPNASFAGHLAGILVGFAFVYGPLERIINKVDNFIGQNRGTIQRQRNAGSHNRSYTYRSGTSGYRTSNGGRRDNLDGRGQHEFQEAARRSMDSAQEEREFQEAIRRSLEETHFSMNDNQRYGPTHYPPYPQYGWNIPDFPVQDNQLRNRYPPHRGSRINEADAPYPCNSTYGFYHGNEGSSLPYPVNDDISDSAFPRGQTLYPNLRGFDESSSTGNEPSAPNPELFGVD